mmetsp:Transcript_9656/g.11887  ORF Transcript_9656/g.11887 Transcript_9656/m.11887 type:complete len:268 (-) Transcript_9656:1415-2218(-)|eukprot:CAMPEP_0170471972 /NCGR_PEP_ID=MMETSP0123-20130129/14087_1 /TAXON_ID=182087 /ORGANISM="Favella ehrenbergii, Strain Fehren 1" /LENGTH=267 /DNA_ID=CAMNT_0010739945 /DNA_START=15 /DNA_END=818 /DNA_ORIENTATION=-
MKVLDPFAGYRLASGHPIFHLSLFIGSFVAPSFYEQPKEILPEYEVRCYDVLRWGHFGILFLSIISGYCAIDSSINPEDENKNGKIDYEEVASAELRRRHRDSIWKISARVFDTISVFFYQGAVFYVQLNVYENQSICKPSGRCFLDAPKNSYMIWLYIEIYCFYGYLASAIFYTIFHMLVSGIICKKKTTKSDMNKTYTDFLTYAYGNLVWFAMNFVLVFMPIICMVLLNTTAHNLDIESAKSSYSPLMISVATVNLIQFILRPNI